VTTVAAAVAPSIEEPSIEEQTSIAQRKVRATRAELRALLFDEGDDADVFPRSATMRLLMNATHRRAASAMLSLVLFKLAPGFSRALKAIPMSMLLRTLFRTVR
jgi:hypothetical protein